MKEFEKWQDEFGHQTFNSYWHRKAAWKAALEWVLGASQCSGDSADMFWDDMKKKYVNTGCDVRNAIREELQGE